MKKLGKKQYMMYRHGHFIYGIPLLISGVVVMLALPMDIAIPLNITLFGFGFTGFMRWYKDCKKILERITQEGRNAQREGLPVTSNPYQVNSEEDFHCHWNAGWKYQLHACEAVTSVNRK